MKSQTLFSKEKEAKKIIIDLKKQLIKVPKLLMIYSSSCLDGALLHKELKEAFPLTEIIGSTTYGEIAEGEMHKGTVIAMAFSEQITGSLQVEVVENVREDKEGKGIKKAFESFENHFKVSTKEMDYKKYVGIVLTDFATGSEEKIMDKIGDLTNVMFVGGSSADNWEFQHTKVFANGKSYQNAVVLLMMKPNTEFGFIKTQSFKDTNKKFTATKVDPETRVIYELNNRPAGEVYAEALNVELENASEKFSSNPLGVVVGHEIYVRSPIDIQKDKMAFVSSTLEGMEVTILESTDIILDTKEAVEKKVAEMGGEISALINFNCTLRTVELEKKNLTKEYAEIFKELPSIGFSVYGEAYLGHVNQTATMIVFK